MRDRDLAQAERLITECKNRIARQRGRPKTQHNNA